MVWKGCNWLSWTLYTRSGAVKESNYHTFSNSQAHQSIFCHSTKVIRTSSTRPTHSNNQFGTINYDGNIKHALTGFNPVLSVGSMADFPSSSFLILKAASFALAKSGNWDVVLPTAMLPRVVAANTLWNHWSWYLYIRSTVEKVSNFWVQVSFISCMRMQSSLLLDHFHTWRYNYCLTSQYPHTKTK